MSKIDGLFDAEAVCEKGIILCNSAIKDLISGQYLAFVNKIEQTAQIFAKLKTGIKADRESLENTIEELKLANDALMQEITGTPVIKESSDDGNGKE